MAAVGLLRQRGPLQALRPPIQIRKAWSSSWNTSWYSGMRPSDPKPILKPLPSTSTATKQFEGAPPARTRFAPSPTGQLHLGSLRTALFNYLWAKHTGGQFLLRIEDTDQKRTVTGAEESIYRTLRWAGILWDEGPEVGGPYGPYIQSERTEIYKQYAHKLVHTGHAYRCFCTSERLEELAKARAKRKLPTEYDRHCLNSISGAESEERAAKGETYTIRLKAPEQFPVFNDLVYGDIQYGTMKFDQLRGSFADHIILKSDGFPTYHLASVVDDHIMKITHVIRATEWMPSTPKHVFLYQCFGWAPPAFAHVGLLQNEKGKKLSKRDGDVDVFVYQDQGYLPEALNNFVALLGWSHSRENDVMNMQDLVKEFTLNRLTSGNAIVTFEKLEFLQKAHIPIVLDSPSRRDEMLSTMCARVKYHYPALHDSYIKSVLEIDLKNLVLPGDYVTNLIPFFHLGSMEEFWGYSRAAFLIRRVKNLCQKYKLGVPVLIYDLMRQLERVPEAQWKFKRLQELFPPAPDKREEKDVYDRHVGLMLFMRYAVMGGYTGPSIPLAMSVLGKKITFERIEEALDMWKPAKRKQEATKRIFDRVLRRVGGDGREAIDSGEDGGEQEDDDYYDDYVDPKGVDGELKPKAQIKKLKKNSDIPRL